MDKFTTNHLDNIFPEIIKVVDRNATPSWKLQNEQMKTHNLMLIYEGKGEFVCNDNKFKVSRGDLVYYKIGDFRKAKTSPDNLMKSFAIDFLYTCPTYIKYNWKLMHYPLPFSPVQKIGDEHLLSKLIDLFSRLTRSALSSKDRSKVSERLIFIEILTLLFKFKEGNKYNYSNMRKVDKVINYMLNNYQNNITLNELASYAEISSSYLGSMFKKVTGKTVIDYLIEIRINKSKSLLRDGFSVSETSKLVGFNDIFYFSKTFKKYEGINPSQYDISKF